MKLIYAYALHYRNFRNQAFMLTDSYCVLLIGDPGKWNGIKIEKVDEFQMNTPPNILSVSALVGRNATGKTNFVEMIGAVHQSKNKDSIPGDAFFLLYAPNEDEENDRFYFEVSSPDKFGDLFSWMKSDQIREGCSYAAGWCRYDSGGKCLRACEAEALIEVKTVMVSLCDRLQSNDKNSSYEFPIRRYVKNYRTNTFASQAKVIQKIYCNDSRTVLRDPEYKLEATCDMRFLECGPEDAPLKNTPLFPPLYRRVDIPEEKRNAVRLAEGWIKIFAESQIENFDARDDLQRKFEKQADMAHLSIMPQSFVVDGRFREDMVLKVLNKYLEIITDDLTENAISVVKDAEFLRIILTDPLLKRTESGFTISVAPVSRDSEKNIQILIQTLIDNPQLDHGQLGTFLSQTWANISDGELWYIHFLASISEVLEDIKKDGETHTCILILDEPEIHMHPDLARQLLDQLTQWLKDYTDTKIQIILTTHSPFILSDIERGNVQILRRSGSTPEQEYWVEVKSQAKQTYAANIYAILTDSIFMDSGFGEIARKQLKDVLQSLQSKNLNNEEERERIRAVIDKIGEQIVKRKLEEFYQNKYDISQ